MFSHTTASCFFIQNLKICCNYFFIQNKVVPLRREITQNNR